MNQDQVKRDLLAIRDAPLDFSLVFSGKSSKKVNGLYKPDSREIIIHNRNFSGESADNALMYTAIHEYAHHLRACALGGTLPARAHASDFWATFHGLLDEAEEKGVYRNCSGDSQELRELTEIIREKYLRANGALVKELGERLLRAKELCERSGARFEDYLDRTLRIPRAAASAAMKISGYDLSPDTGADNMRFLAGIPGRDERRAAEASLLAGKSPDAVKVVARKKPEPESPTLALEKEKQRIKRTIEALERKLEEVEARLAAASGNDE